MTGPSLPSSERQRATPQRGSRITSDEVARQLVFLIREKVYAPGDRLREIDLAQRFGVSRAIIREALHLLSARNLVHTEANRGASVPRLNDAEAIEAVELSAALFGLAVRRSARCAGGVLPEGVNESLSRLEALTSGMENAGAFYQETLRLAAKLILPFNSKRLLSLLEDGRLGAPDHYGPVGYSPEAARTISVGKWRALVSAIESGDEETADRLAREIHYDTLSIALAIVG